MHTTSSSWQSSDDLFCTSPKPQKIFSRHLCEAEGSSRTSHLNLTAKNVWLFACEITLSSQTMKQHCSVFPTERLCAFFSWIALKVCLQYIIVARLASLVLSTSLLQGLLQDRPKNRPHILGFSHAWFFFFFFFLQPRLGLEWRTLVVNYEAYWN